MPCPNCGAADGDLHNEFCPKLVQGRLDSNENDTNHLKHAFDALEERVTRLQRQLTLTLQALDGHVAEQRQLVDICKGLNASLEKQQLAMEDIVKTTQLNSNAVDGIARDAGPLRAEFEGIRARLEHLEQFHETGLESLEDF